MPSCNGCCGLHLGRPYLLPGTSRRRSCGLGSSVRQPIRSARKLSQHPGSRNCNSSQHLTQHAPRAQAHANGESPANSTGSSTLSSLWKSASACGLLLAAGLLCTARPAHSAENRDSAKQQPGTSVSVSESKSWLSDAERLAQAQERSGNVCSSSNTTGPPLRASRSHRTLRNTGIELASVFTKKKEDVKEMSPSEAMKYYHKEYKDDPLYGDLFPVEKKGKKFNTMESQAIDPNDWDHPEFRPMTAWRVDRMKDMTYTQLWFLIREHKVEKAKFSRDHRTIAVTTKSTAPGGKRTERVGLPYDPDFYHHMISHGVQVEIPEPSQNLDSVLYAIFYLLWPIFFACFLFIFILQIQFSPGEPSDEERLFQGAKLDKLDKSQHKLTFADIAGIDNVKAEVQELVEFLRSPKRFLDLGAKSPAGVMLVGAPGTGKTLLAKAIAGEAGVRFLSVAGTEFDQMYVGVGASRVRDMFRQARESSPCILFIDEFDGIGKQRSLSAQDESANTINSLLTEMDGFEDNSGVIVMAATNRPQALDSALTRPGRFDRVIEMPLPNIDGREEILRVHGRNKRVAVAADYNAVARTTAGYSGAQLMNVMNVSAVEATRRGATAITTEHMLAAIENIEGEEFGSGAAGAMDEDEPPPLSLRRQIAVYEGARALIGAITPHFEEVAKVSCCPDNQATGSVKFLPNEEQLESQVLTRDTMEAQMVVNMAGRCAERLVLGDGNISTAGTYHIDVANMIAYEMILKYGFSKRLGPVGLMTSRQGYLGENEQSIADMGPSMSAAALADIQELMSAAEAKASYGLVCNWSPLQKIIQHLMEHETLTGTQLNEILDQNEALYFPDPFIEGFGYDEDHGIVYPGYKEIMEEAAQDTSQDSEPSNPEPVLTADELETATLKAESQGEISPDASSQGTEAAGTSSESRILEASTSENPGRVLQVSASNPQPEQPDEEDQEALLEEMDEEELEKSLEGLSDEELAKLAEEADDKEYREETIARAKAFDYNDPYQRLRRMPPYPYRVRDDYQGGSLDSVDFKERYERSDEGDSDNEAERYREKRRHASRLGLEGENEISEEVIEEPEEQEIRSSPLQ